ncbi:translocation and assembly module TamB [Sphaerotilus hippei]|uniref:Translocation and assembly module TamB n=1 Tax=Sphaerotilus hippei TaxID=744406 RepID=A0A318H0K1_9BURK|nr:translocation/assembly module TamB domain-containing protein [Sphaerotilus hippei]PXW96274.1 translocation and assembly module TamB [Sphaerotilus hippei]
MTPDDTNPPAPAPTAADGPRPRRRRWPWALAVVGLLGAALGGLASLPFSATGSRWLLEQVPGLAVTAPRGALAGDFQAARLSYRLGPGRTLLIDDLAWQGWQRVPGGLRLATLKAGRIDLQGSAPPDDRPTVLPTRLQLPFGLEVQQLQVGQLVVDAIRDRPVEALQARVALRGGDAATHELQLQHLAWDRLDLAGRASIGAAAPLNLAARLQLGTRRDPGAPADAAAPALPADTSLQLQADGPLARFQLQADLQASGQSLQARAEVQPAQPLPVSALQARLKDLDLAPLATGLPQTALSGLVDLRLQPGAGTAPGSAPLRIDLQLDNPAAGPWEAQRLPVRRLHVSASSRADHPQAGELGTLLAELGSTRQPAGTLRGSGQWRFDGGQPQTARLELQLEQIQPMNLSAAAPSMRISGPLSLALRRTAPPVATGAAASSPADRPALLPAGLSLTLDGDLQGQLLSAAGLPPAARQAVRVQLDTTLEGQRIEVRRFIAEAGAARAQARGDLSLEATGDTARWQLRGDAGLTRFDPAPWWPAAAAWGASRLDGRLEADLKLPARSAAAPAPAARTTAADTAPIERLLASLGGLTGQARLLLSPSMLAGVPVQGDLQIRRSGTQTAPQALLQFEADGSRLDAEVQLDRDGTRDRGHLSLQSPALERLAPWWRLVGADLRASGDLQGRLDWQGRWPQLRSTGRLDSQRVLLQGPAGAATAPVKNAAGGPAAPALTTLASLQALQAQWDLGSADDAPWSLELRASQLTQGANRLQDVQGQLTGTLGQHRLELRSGLDRAAATPPPAGTLPMRPLQARLQVDGGLQRSARAWRWNGRLQQLLVQESAPARPATGVALAPLAAASPRHLELADVPLQISGQRDADGHASLEAQVGPGVLNLSLARLQLQQLRWRSEQTGSEAARQSLRVLAQLEPLAVAPLLARWQPDFGWGGDLLVGGRIDIDATPEQMRAAVELRRERGDLVVLDSGRPLQVLGLSELQLGLTVQDGLWRLSQRIAGQRLGSVTGDQSLRTRAGAWAPPADAALQGQLRLQVAELGNWGRWLPAGWRLTGQLAGQADVAGTLGAPALGGELNGQQIAVRNPLQGVDWRDARLKVVMQGETARLEQFQVRGGDGQLVASGDLLLGASPSARLDVRAERFAALQRIDRKLVVSGSTRLTVDATSTRISGQLRADEGRIDFSQSDAPSLSDDVDVQRGDTAGAPRPATGGTEGDATSVPRSLVLDLRAQLGENFRLVGRGLATRLTGELHVTSPANRLAVSGDIRSVDGTYAAYAQKLTVDRGVITFTGTPDNPRLDIRAVRPDLEDRIVGVAITGTAQNPRIRLFSEPELTDTEKLSWLVLGRAPDGLGRTDLAVLQRAAFALLTGEDSSPSLVERLGLDQLSVRQTDGDTKETVLSLGKQLSRRWYVGYERSLNAATGTWQLIYRLGQRYTLRAQTGSDNALDLIWSWKWGTGDNRTP